MSKRFYLATRKDRSKQAEPLLEALKAQGWERTFEWTAQDEASTDAYGEVARKELEGVILHAPDRKTLETPYPCIFHHHPAVKILISATPDVAAILACIQ